MLQINVYIVVMVFHFIRVHNFHYLTTAWVKMLLFLEYGHFSYGHFGNNRKDILILRKDTAQKLDHTALTAEAQY